MRCLLVDDEPGIREGLAALLRLRGHEVHTACDVAGATSLARSHEFDIVLTDWRLPDGTARPLYDEGEAPIVVISGHPEEVARSPRVLAVMPKPLMPDRLFELVNRCARPVTAASCATTATTRDLPCDVRAVAESALAALRDADCELTDDGAYVTLRARGVPPARREALEALGGDLRWDAGPGESGSCELRWLRDGRPDAAMPTVAADGAWPACAAFAVDFHGTALGVEAMTVCCERAAVLREGGADVVFVNVPEALVRSLDERGLAALLPCRRPIGPRIGDELSALWA